MSRELTVGHMFVVAERLRKPRSSKEDCWARITAVENNRYRVAKVYNGENWNPGNEAPLTQPGVNVKPGDTSWP